jgi:hypothetical protein
VIWKLACLRENTDTPSGWHELGFPVCKTQPALTERFGNRYRQKLQGLDQSDIDKIEAVQPYQTGTPDPATHLKRLDPRSPHYILEELAILDRHRRLAVTACYPVALNPDVRIVKGFGEVLSVTPDNSKIGQPLKDGDVVGNFRIKFVTNCNLEATPSAVLQVFPCDVLLPDPGWTFDVWVRGMQTCVLDLINTFAPDFGEDVVVWPKATRWWPV